MGMDNKDAPATPHTFVREYHSTGRPYKWRVYHGLTKREHFAGLAMQGLLGNKGMTAGALTAADTDQRLFAELMSASAISIADGLLNALEKE